MTIFGLNSPELFLLLVIALVILGTKRIEKGIDLFLRLLKFLLSNQSNFDKRDKKKEEEIKKTEEKTNAKEKESINVIDETEKKEEESDQKLKMHNVDNNESKSTKIKDPKGIVNEKTLKNLKIKNPKSIVKDKTGIKSKSINKQEEQIEK